MMPKELFIDSMQHFKVDKGYSKLELSELLSKIKEISKNKSNMLFIASEDAEELESIESFVRLMRHRIKSLKYSEMESLVELAMPEINLKQPTEVLDQARRNSELRAAFLRQYEMLDADIIHDMCGSTAINKAALAGGWKKSGKIFSVEYKNRQLYPAFQFENGKIIPVIARILKALGPTMGPWQTAMWFTTKNPDLLTRPVELLKKDPDGIVEAAKKLTTDNLF